MDSTLELGRAQLSALSRAASSSGALVERTLSIIKPDAVAKNAVDKINKKFANARLKVVAAKMVRLSRSEAENFYAAHRGRPFFADLVKLMISDPKSWCRYSKA